MKKEWKGTLYLTIVSTPIRWELRLLCFRTRNVKRSISTNRHPAVARLLASKRKQRPLHCIICPNELDQSFSIRQSNQRRGWIRVEVIKWRCHKTPLRQREVCLALKLRWLNWGSVGRLWNAFGLFPSVYSLVINQLRIASAQKTPSTTNRWNLSDAADLALYFCISS